MCIPPSKLQRNTTQRETLIGRSTQVSWNLMETPVLVLGRRCADLIRIAPWRGLDSDSVSCCCFSARTAAFFFSFQKMSELIQPRGNIIPRLDSIRREELVQVISSHPSCKYAASFLKAVCSFTQAGRWGRWLTWDGWHPITNREVGFRPNKRRRQRSVFTEHDINSLFHHFRKTGNWRATAHFRFFMHTAARHRAVSLSKVCDVMHQNGEVCDRTTLYE